MFELFGTAGIAEAIDHLSGGGFDSPDLDGAIATQRAAIAQRTALFGHDQRETASLFNSLAITLASAYRLDEAMAAYKETSAIYDRLGLGDRLDAQIIRANTGTLAMRIGRLHEAETLLKESSEHERALAGDSAAVAASLGYYGKVLSITDRPKLALATLQEASAMAQRYAGETSPVALQNRLFLGEAQFAASDRDAARATIEAMLATVRGHNPPTHPLVLRGEIALADVDAGDGRLAAAKARLAPVIATLRKAGPAARATLAQALLAQGEIDLAAGDKAAAVASCREAVQLRTAGWPQGWELAVARERLAEALAASGASAEARPLLVEAETALHGELAESHPEVRRAKRALERLPA